VHVLGRRVGVPGYGVDHDRWFSPVSGKRGRRSSIRMNQSPSSRAVQIARVTT
jgi:hypothetical protein